MQNGKKVYEGFSPKTEPYQHQVEAFNRFKDSEYFALFMDMGTGKSKVAIDIASYKFKKGDIDGMMILAPNNVHIQWVEEQLEQHCAIPYKAMVWNQTSFNHNRYRLALKSFIKDDIPALKVFSLNVDALISDKGNASMIRFVSSNRTFCVLDESTRIKNPEAKRSKVLHQFSKEGDFHSRCILTGTPTAKSPLDIWSPFEYLKPKYFGMSWKNFQGKYAVMIRGNDRHQKLIGDYEYNMVKSAIESWQVSDDPNKASDIWDCYGDIAHRLGMTFRDVRFIAESDRMKRYRDEEALKTLIAPDTHSVKKEDCLDLPEKIYENIYVDMSPEQRATYKDLAGTMEAYYENGKLTVRGVLALFVRFMQICGGFFPNKTEDDDYTTLIPFKRNPKLEALLDDIEESTHDKQFIVWSSFSAEIQTIAHRLNQENYRARTYFGMTSEEERTRTVADFRNGKIQALVANPLVAGYGLNLQNCSYQYFFSNSYRTEARIQAEDRSHRIGQANTCVYKDIMIKNSIDQHISQIIRSGKELNEFFKDNDFEDYL